LADIAELFGQFEQAYLARMIFCSLVMVHVLVQRRGRGSATPTSSAPAAAHVEP
jgi:hypothetical protein